MTTAKQRILERLARFHRSDVTLPEPLAQVTTYDDRRQQFQTVLESVGGKVWWVRDQAEATQVLNQLPVVSNAKQLLSYCPQLIASSTSVSGAHDPHQLAEVDVTIAPGQFGVAENGAVWVCDPAIQHRVSLFLSQHLVLVVASGQVVSNMHEAYTQIGQASLPFSGFISGPSKTADIEQSLVIGAHGARSLHVLVLDAP